MSENEAPDSSGQPDPFPLLDRAGYDSYSHVDLLGVHFNVNQQIGIPFLFAAVAALVGVVKLASNDRCLVAQCRFLLADTTLNRLQLSEALAVLMEKIKPSEH